LPSNCIRKDGIYFFIQWSASEAYRDQRLRNNFHFRGIAFGEDCQFFEFSELFSRTKTKTYHYDIVDVIEMCASDLRNPYNLKKYSISCNIHNVIASYSYQDLVKSIECTIYSNGHLVAKEYIKHDNDFIEERQENIFEFMPLNRIDQGLSETDFEPFFPKEPKSWWRW
jgi:hypothetical protein